MDVIDGKGRLPLHPRNPITWIWIGLHMVTLLILWSSALILPVKYSWVVLLGFVFVWVHWMVLNECVISILEKRSEIPDYVVDSLPCSTYLISIPSYILRVDYFTVRDYVNVLTTTSAMTATAIILLIAPNELVARLPQRARVVLAYICIGIFARMLQLYDRRSCSGVKM